MNSHLLPKDSKQLASSLDYAFNKQELLLQALRHPSFVYESDIPELSDNQRFEFLGDAVINLAISHLLMEFFPDIKEGDLSKYRASLVSENGLFAVAQEIELGDYLFLGKGEERTHGRKKASIVSDALEALVGAVYLDGGFHSALKIIARLFSPILNNLCLGKSVNDFKTDLQEYSQEVFQSTPEYQLEKEIGPDHNKTFYVGVYLRGKVMGKGTGKSKKEAEQRAAKEALACLRK